MNVHVDPALHGEHKVTITFDRDMNLHDFNRAVVDLRCLFTDAEFTYDRVGPGAAIEEYQRSRFIAA